MAPWRRSPRGRKAAQPLAELLKALLFHFLFTTGTLAEHFRQLTGVRRAESTLAERRQALGWKVFAQWLRQALRPLAQPRSHAQAFWRGLRLVAWDGVQFSLTNTPQILDALPKAKARRRTAAWAKLTAVVLLELGLHNPLAAAVGWQGESEYALTPALLAALPAQALLLADRLTGIPALLFQVWQTCETAGSHFLVRVRKNLHCRILRRFADGSALIEVRVPEPKHPRRSIGTLILREIAVRVWRPGNGVQVIRLWTTLLDPKTAPALELARLYLQRWEQELYWRQMKYDLHKSGLLQSHTPETAAQEVALLVLATALVAQERARAATGQCPVLELSFGKCLELLRPLWMLLCLARDVLHARVKQQLTAAVYREIGRCLKPKRRWRSCPRAVRQPVGRWPRLLETKYVQGPWHYAIIAKSASSAR